MTLEPLIRCRHCAKPIEETKGYQDQSIWRHTKSGDRECDLQAQPPPRPARVESLQDKEKHDG